MSSGFGQKNKSKIIVNKKELESLIQKYKKLKKYQKSSLFAIKTIDGTEKIINSLIEEAKEIPL
jgi:hypothetical protein